MSAEPVQYVQRATVRRDAGLVVAEDVARVRCDVVYDSAQALAAIMSPPLVARPFLDDDGLLRFRGRWVAVPDAQLPLAQLLVERFQTTVPDAELADAYEYDGPAGSRALSGALSRLARRVTDCGLVLRRVRGRGYILDRRV